MMKAVIARKMSSLKRTLRRRGPRRDGFTLVEILVVLMILAIGILPLALVQGQSRRDVAESERYAMAMEVAKAQMEAAKGLGFGNALPDSGSVGNMQWRRSVQNVSFGLDQLQVVVTWTEEAGDRDVQVTNLISMR